MPPFARISSLDRLLACSAGEALGGVDEKSGAAQAAADWGTMVHGWKETGRIVAPKGRSSFPNLFRRKLEATGVRRERWWPGTVRHETALAINPGTAYAMHDGEGKEAWKWAWGEEWLVGTCDGRDWILEDALWVDDLKTGRDATFEKHEKQLLGYALGVARALDYRRPVHLTVTWWPRYPVASLPQRFGRVVEPDELDAFEARLVVLRDEMRRAREDRSSAVLRPGAEQCSWCPSRGVCPVAVPWEATWQTGF